MGLDGGTIISRSDVLRGASWELSKADNSRSSRGGAVRGTHSRRKLDARTSRVTRWTTCALSGRPLSAPVVACFLGRLYNRTAVLEFLLGRAGHYADDAALHAHANILRSNPAGAFDHIQSIKDVFTLAYAPAAPAEGAAVATTADGSADPVLAAPYSCPLTHLRCDTHAFAALRPCGHVFAERAIRECSSDGTCPTCGRRFSEAAEDVVPLLPGEEEEARLRELLPGRRKAKGKKERAHGSGQAAGAEQQRQGEEAVAQQKDGDQEPQPKRQRQQRQQAEQPTAEQPHAGERQAGGRG